MDLAAVGFYNNSLIRLGLPLVCKGKQFKVLLGNHQLGLGKHNLFLGKLCLVGVRKQHSIIIYLPHKPPKIIP